MADWEDAPLSQSNWEDEPPVNNPIIPTKDPRISYTYGEPDTGYETNWIQDLATKTPGYEYNTFVPAKRNIKTRELEWAAPGILKEMAAAIVAPGMAEEGLIDYNSPEAIQQAINLGGMVQLGSLTRNALGKPQKGSPSPPMERVEPTLAEETLPAVFRSNRAPAIGAIKLGEEIPSQLVVSPKTNPVQTSTFPDVETATITPEEVAAARTTDATHVESIRPTQMNLTQFSSDKEVAALVEATMGKFTPQQISRAKRGTITHEQAQAMADATGHPPEYFLSRGIGSVYNVEDTKRFQNIIDNSSREMDELSAKVVSGEASQEELVNFYKAGQVYTTLLSKFLGAGSESARTLNILNSAAKNLNKQKYLQSVLDRISPDDLMTRAKIIQDASKNGNLKEILAKGAEWDWSNVFFEAWKSGMLTGLKSPMKNLAGNTLTNLTTVPERILSGTIGSIRTLRPGSNPEQVRVGEVLAMLKGYSSIKQGGLNFLEAMKKEDYLLEGGNKADVFEKAITGEKFKSTNIYKKLPVSMQDTAEKAIDLTGQGIRITFRTLNATDVLFKTVAAQQQLQALALRKALNSGLKDPQQIDDFVAKAVFNPTKEEMSAAMDWAHYVTFTQELGSAGRAVQNVTRKYWPLHLKVPFTTTPINITKWFIERTPLQLMSPTTRAEIAKGGVEADMAMGKLVAGAGMLWGLSELVGSNVISKPYSLEPGQAKMEYEAGYRPYHYVTDDGKYIPLDTIDPIASQVVLASHLGELAKYYQEDMPNEAQLTRVKKFAALGIDAMKNTLVDKQYASGFAELIGASSSDKIGNLLESTAKSFVPTIIKDLEVLENPITYDYASKPVSNESPVSDIVTGSLSGMGQAIQSSVPLIDKGNLRPALDIWGMPRERKGFSMFWPWTGIELSKDPLTLLRLKYSISQPTTADEFKETGLDLTDQEQYIWKLRQGRQARALMEKAYDGEGSILKIPAGDNKVLQKMQAEWLKAINTSASQMTTAIMGMEKLKAEKDKFQEEKMKQLFPKPKRKDIVE